MLHTGGRKRCRGPGFSWRRGRAWARVKALPTDSQSQGAGAPDARGRGQAAPAGGERTAAGDQPCSLSLQPAAGDQPCSLSLQPQPAACRRPALQPQPAASAATSTSAAGSCPQPSLRLPASRGVTACRPCGALPLWHFPLIEWSSSHLTAPRVPSACSTTSPGWPE